MNCLQSLVHCNVCSVLYIDLSAPSHVIHQSPVLHGVLLPQIQQLAAACLLAWATLGGPSARSKLSALGLNPSLSEAAMSAVARGEDGRDLQLRVMRWVGRMGKRLVHRSPSLVLKRLVY